MNKKYQSYYTKSEPILNYMVSMLDLQNDDTVFEPCGGDGVFIDKVLSYNDKLPITVYELNPDAVNTLTDKYKERDNVFIKQTDTLLDPELSFEIKFGGLYDKVIGNPPYGGWYDVEKRKELKDEFPDIYSKETYTLFLRKCIASLNEHGRLCFIIPDTFLSLHRHKAIRQYILSNTKIIELSLFPSSFFPGVNFGYANLCIITVEKSSSSRDNLANCFTVKTNFDKVNEVEKNTNKTKIKEYKQENIMNNVDSSFLISSDSHIIDLVNKNEIKIGDIADCVTGFYSGNDKKYLKAASPDVRNASRYPKVTPEEKCSREIDANEQILGIKEIDCFVPIVKGGNKRYIKPNDWYMNWSSSAIEEFRASKKCRFQNSKFYFNSSGIGVPMIRSSRMTAALIDGRIFDQSIVGIFPHDSSLTMYLLAFFNSKTCTELIKVINPSTNNSANYIKKLPFISPSTKDLNEINVLIKDIVNSIKKTGTYDIKLDDTIDSIFHRIYNV